MDRFLSKLDLRDIKIKPEGNQFSPTDDETETVESPVAVEADDVEAAETVDEGYQAPYEASTSTVADSPLHVSETAQIESETDATDEENEEQAQEESDDKSDRDNSEVLKVSGKSRPSAVAGAIAGVVRENGRAEVQAIGAGATNQAVKAVAIARDYLWESELDVICVPEFIDVIIDGDERTAIRLVVEVR